MMVKSWVCPTLTEDVTVTAVPPLMLMSCAAVSMTVWECGWLFAKGSGLTEDVYVAPPEGGLARSAAGTQSVCVCIPTLVDVESEPLQLPLPASGFGDPAGELEDEQPTGIMRSVTVAPAFVRN